MNKIVQREIDNFKKKLIEFLNENATFEEMVIVHRRLMVAYNLPANKTTLKNLKNKLFFKYKELHDKLMEIDKNTEQAEKYLIKEIIETNTEQILGTSEILGRFKSLYPYPVIDMMQCNNSEFDNSEVITEEEEAIKFDF
ncbi:hypothetical protein CWI37_0731p0020 [Hamiltosporidium tvaerminnensis]|uniref:Uncharacterized protein n=2 Tax=Hamiltosporidium TaxID=1176354 RepID=A0A4Q9KVV6_9MICR|nr:hypothetical protein LUQ84_003051 [Hamiltosporidium tvaerminnensis]TBT99042.1 hypothetical protein CWI37_1490p0010 [Hamiltosporidium tvaerminnensis]TBT99362.1 hypothetical protein CWI39_2050p0010 [Hamiltosporidium magnivora]TBU01350.1 hypothetical protein CWI37_0731p0020 [Hamiltosporidium tvaerminnensis]